LQDFLQPAVRRPVDLTDSYDLVRYPSLARDQSHPAHIAALAQIAGVALPPIERWRVLEIGCGNASNLIPIALDYPDGEFLGIDRAAAPLQEGRALISDLGIANLELQTSDLLDWQPTGEFDYIIAHGVYSWTPPVVREKILRLCAHHLKPLGIAFISYNALPGCHFRRFAWELLRFHVRRDADPAVRIAKAREFAQIMVRTPGDEPLQPGIRDEFETILKRDPAALYHDDLGETNDPFYLLDFVAEAARHGLQYLGDADPRRDDLQGQPAFAEDWLEARQYMDFLARRRFRETLLCRRRVPVDRNLSIERLQSLFASSRMRPGEALEDGTQSFYFPGAGRLTTNHPLAKRLLCELSGIWPSSMRLAEFSFKDHAPDSVAALIMQLACSKALQLRTRPPRIAASVGDRPTASPLARAQLARGYPMVTNQRHQDVELTDEVSRKFLAMLDGSRDRTAR
jgi:SAM-dependent methyltransferase